MRRALAISNLARTGLTLAACLMGSLAMAGPINFASRQVNIRAGVVVTDANRYAGVTANDAPFVWFNVSQNALVKPAGWNFFNPHAPGQMTQDMFNRWSAITAANGGTPPVGVTQPLTKSMAGYWEVPITSVSDATISDYDVLLLPAYENLSLNPSERGRLRRFVDQGGVLWIDVADSTTLDVANSAPLSFNSQLVAAGNTTIVDPTSQLFSFPNALTWLPDASPRNTLIPVDLAAAGYASLIPVLSSVDSEFWNYEVDATSLGQPTVVTARLGAGAIVVTSRGAAAILNRTMNGATFNPNVGFVALTGLSDSNASQVGLFAINLINLLNGSTQADQGSRKSNSIPTDNGGPLIQTFHDETEGGPMPTAQPIEYKGMMIVASQNRIYAYSAVPGSDLDQDGNPDDGYQDYGFGRSRDKIWQSVTLNGPLSAPAALSVPNGSGGTMDEIAVVDGGGNLVTLNAFPLNANGTFNGTTDNPVLKSYAPPNGAAETNPGVAPFGPTVHDGLIYVTDNIQTALGSTSGRVWVVNPAANGGAGDYAGAPGKAFAVGSTSSAVLQQASQSVTIGYIPIQDNSGGADCVAYVPTAPQPSGFGGATCGIASVWIATKGEQHPISIDTGNNWIQVAPRASANSRPIYVPGGADPLGVHLTLMTANGDALTVAQMSTILAGTVTYAGPGSPLTFPLTGTGQAQLTALGVTTVSIDYHLDWDNTSTQVGNVVRGTVQLPDDTNRTKVILGNLALSPAGTLYAVEADPNNSDNTGGMFYALREQGQGAFNVVARFDLYDGFNMVVPSSTESTQSGTPISATFEDNDPTQTIPGASNFISGNFTSLCFESGPAVMDGRVFVKVRGYKTATLGYKVPCMLLLCFAAEPNPPTFTVPVLRGNFAILQPDVNKSIDKTQPDVFTTVSSNQLTYTVGTDHATISLNSLSSTNRGQLAQTLSESLPVVIQQPGEPNLTVDPSLNGTWSPLQWYTVFYGLDPGMFQGNTLGVNFDTGAPVVTGNTVYAAGNSFVPYIFQGINPIGQTPTGMIIGYNGAATGATDPFAVPNFSRPYFTQLVQLKATPTFAANPDMEWPLNSTATSFQEYLQRLYQTVLDGANLTNAPVCFGLAAGKDSLFAYSNLGVYGYKKADVVVADEDRLASFDPSGEAQWSTNQTLYYNASLAAGTLSPADSRPLVRPTRAYAIDANDYIVVDPGSNRMAWIDKAGHEIRSIDSFNVDPSYVPQGYVSGETRTFNSPQDMLTFTEYVLQANNPYTDNSTPVEFWRHYVIADTGNHRFLEIVDRYAVDVATHQPTYAIAQNLLFYHSPANLSGKGYDYNGIARLAVESAIPNGPPQFVYAASIGSTEPTRVGLGLDPTVQQTIPTAGSNPFQLSDTRDGNGGIVVLSPNGTQVINQVAVPAIAPGVVYDPTTGLFNAQPIPAHYIKLGAVTSVSLSYYFPDTVPDGGQQLRIMCTTSTGVYEMAYTNNPVIGVNGTPQDWVVQWMLPNEVYTQLRRDPISNLPNQNLFLNAAQFRATYARRTSAGTVLITNGYVGTDQDAAATRFQGEVLEVDGSELAPGLTRGFSWTTPFFGFDALSIWYSLPSVSGARGIIAPIFADRR